MGLLDHVGKFMVNVTRREEVSRATGKRLLLDEVLKLELELRVYLPREQLPVVAYMWNEMGRCGEVHVGVYNFRDVVRYRVWELREIVRHVLPFLKRHDVCLVRQKREVDAMRLCARWLVAGAGTSKTGQEKVLAVKAFCKQMKHREADAVPPHLIEVGCGYWGFRGNKG